jgi:hypothetical protein
MGESYLSEHSWVDTVRSLFMPLVTLMLLLPEAGLPPRVATNVVDPNPTFPSRIQRQKDSGSRIRIRIKEFTYF